MKYRKKPVEVEAIQYTGKNLPEIINFVGRNLRVRGNLVVIFTLEGEMIVSELDYVIKGVNGEFYPCKPDIFEKTYDKSDDLSYAMDFGDAIEVLKQGGAIRRKGWNGKGLFVIKQVQSHIESEIIPKMQSLPQSAKDLILKGKGFIDYTSQCLIYNENTGRADSWVPSISDVFAEDWEIVQ